MKKIIAALLAAALSMGLSACSQDKESGGTGLDTSAPASTGTAPEKPETAEPEVIHTEPVITSSVTASAVTEETEPTAETTETVTAEAAPRYAEMMIAFDNAYLGFPSMDKVYIFSDTDKTAEIDGEICHAVSAYDEHEGTLYYMCDFYITEDGTRVYRYYEAEERFALLPEKQGFERLNPTTQQPDEIFATANMLYGLFTNNKADIRLDSQNQIEFNGSVYVLVTDDAIGTKAKLLDALSKYFSSDIVNALMDTNRFIEQDGMLYYQYLVGGTDPSYRGTVYELTDLTESNAVFTGYSTFEYEAGETVEVESTYTAENQFGVWRFTEFSLPWQ